MKKRALAVALLVLLAGCTVDVSLDGLEDAADDSLTPESRNATVVEVVDGDTVDVRFPDGSVETLRLLGVDSPEVYSDVNPGEFEGVPDTEAGHSCLDGWADNASRFATERLAGERVVVSTDALADRRGSYGRLLAYVTVQGNDESFNHALLDEGYARLYDSEFTRKASFVAAEQAARSNDTGLWACSA